MQKPQITKRGWDISVVGESDELSRNEVLQKAADAEASSRATDEGMPESDDAEAHGFHTHHHKH